jgi:uncharacterized protein YcaQ
VPRRTTVSINEARRIALAAQGLAGRRPERTGGASLTKVFERVQLVQIDSVNVLCRSQELPLWTRLGPHDRRLLPSALERRRLFEYWAHAACLAPVELHPLMRWRMAEAFQNGAWGSLVALGKKKPRYVQAVLDEVRARGPLAASQMSDAAAKRRPGQWWSWGDHKRALELLFWSGALTTARRTSQFERVYDLTERVLPGAVLALPTPSVADAQRALLERAARALGVGTATDIADYFRIRNATARPRIAELVEAGTLVPVRVERWNETAYLHRDAVLPVRAEAAALLSPFDSLVWERKRTERLFGFHYRIEIYTPLAKRRFGYYVLPFLLGERLVARVDLKADRQAGALLVHAAATEDGVKPPAVAGELARELRALATWLGLENVVVGTRGNLAKLLLPAGTHGRAGRRATTRETAVRSR